MTKKPVPQNPSQQGLFESNTVLVDSPEGSKTKGTGIRKRDSLLPTYHANRDFFVADLLDIALKSDRASLEVPIFSLATRPDKSIFQWSSKDGNRMLRVVPSVLGRATQMDKDVLIYIISQVMEAENRGREDFNNKTITENGRATYSLKSLNNIAKDSRGGIPSNIFFIISISFL